MSEQSQKVYVSGQITGLSEEEYRENFENACKVLQSHGYETINPLNVLACTAENCNPNNETLGDGSYKHTWECYLKHDIKALVDCDLIYMLPNWTKSRGARFELDVAMGLNIPVTYFQMMPNAEGL